MRNFACVENIQVSGARVLCKAKNLLFSAGNGVSVMGKQVASEQFSCLKFDEDLSMMFGGDRCGNLHIFKI